MTENYDLDTIKFDTVIKSIISSNGEISEKIMETKRLLFQFIVPR